MVCLFILICSESVPWQKIKPAFNSPWPLTVTQCYAYSCSSLDAIEFNWSFTGLSVQSSSAPTLLPQLQGHGSPKVLASPTQSCQFCLPTSSLTWHSAGPRWDSRSATIACVTYLGHITSVNLNIHIKMQCLIRRMIVKIKRYCEWRLFGDPL